MKRLERLEMVGITKTFGAVTANDGVDLQIRSGEILGLLGENGAGKTTLMNILYGLYQADGGEIRVNGDAVRLSSPRDAMDCGIGMVHQHFMLVQKHTVAENVALGYEQASFFNPARGVAARLAEFASRYGLSVDPNQKIWELSAGQQQRVEIVKALLQGADLLILDEPTSVLTPQEAEDLFKILRRMTAEGHAIILISHKLEEVLSICTRIMVLRRGRTAGVANPAEVDRRELARMMVGRDVIFDFQRRDLEPGDPILEVSDLRVRDDRGHLAVRGVTVAVHQSEIVGIAGVSGNGQRELVEAITGLRRAEGGEIRVDDRDITNCSARLIADRGVSHVPEERIRFGVVPNLFVSENSVLKQHHKTLFSRFSLLDHRAIRRHAAGIVKGFQVATLSLDIPVKNLSGGNIQKLILGREIVSDHRLLVAAHPTYGLDVGATEYIRGQLLERRERGEGVLLVSEDLEEIFELADRIAVMYEGRLVGIVNRGEAKLEEIGLMMAGSSPGGPV